ncbi:hypothetical protein [uncultured Fibrobacter sp.]|uniref:hypothetical protein n=1 Tax=uncultured Fibrobacter sp. TaxID=261512 RepID=UPI0028060BCB|nr:hypothetical protein [uncultured Fibrobacter sp.]
MQTEPQNPHRVGLLRYRFAPLTVRSAAAELQKEILCGVRMASPLPSLTPCALAFHRREKNISIPETYSNFLFQFKRPSSPTFSPTRLQQQCSLQAYPF